MACVCLLIEPHGIPTVNHVDMETMGSFGFPWFPIGDPVDIHWIPWYPMVTRGFPLGYHEIPMGYFCKWRLILTLCAPYIHVLLNYLLILTYLLTSVIVIVPQSVCGNYSLGVRPTADARCFESGGPTHGEREPNGALRQSPQQLGDRKSRLPGLSNWWGSGRQKPKLQNDK